MMIELQNIKVTPITKSSLDNFLNKPSIYSLEAHCVV